MLLRKGEVTSVELTEACLGAIEAAGALNAFVHKTPEIALERARAADARLRGRGAGDVRHPGRHQGPVLHRRACPARPRAAS
jgi:Asp-tRNA(Asn)/Glu-tRNA(Gln) amidotransferase A subunit family amidase